MFLVSDYSINVPYICVCVCVCIYIYIYIYIVVFVVVVLAFSGAIFSVVLSFLIRRSLFHGITLRHSSTVSNLRL